VDNVQAKYKKKHLKAVYIVFYEYCDPILQVR